MMIFSIIWSLTQLHTRLEHFQIIVTQYYQLRSLLVSFKFEVLTCLLSWEIGGNYKCLLCSCRRAVECATVQSGIPWSSLEFQSSIASFYSNYCFPHITALIFQCSCMSLLSNMFSPGLIFNFTFSNLSRGNENTEKLTDLLHFIL